MNLYVFILPVLVLVLPPSLTVTTVLLYNCILCIQTESSDTKLNACGKVKHQISGGVEAVNPLHQAAEWRRSKRHFQTGRNVRLQLLLHNHSWGWPDPNFNHKLRLSAAESRFYFRE